MSSLKLSTAITSICGTPNKWVRSISATTKPTVSLSAVDGTISSVLTTTTTTTLRCKTLRTLRPCAPTIPSAHVSGRAHVFIINGSRKGLGFRYRGPACLSSSSSSGKGAASHGSGIVTDMGQDNGVGTDHAGLCNGDQAPRPSPSMSPDQQKQHSSSKLLTLPTILTIGRVAAVPLLVATFYIDSWWGRTATTSIFIAAAITDWLDGYIARKMSLGSAFGAFLDPVADKLMVAATLILLCTKPVEVAAFGQLPWLLTVPSIAIIGREITMSAVREWAASQNGKLLEAVAVNNLGKWKTATQMIALTILLATRDGSAGGLAASGVVLLYISAGLSVWSLVVYMGKIRKVLLK